MASKAEPHRFFERKPPKDEQGKISAYQDVFNIYKEKIEDKKVQLNNILAQLREQTEHLAKLVKQPENELTQEETGRRKSIFATIESLKMSEEKLRQEIDSLFVEDELSLLDLHLHNPEVEN